MEGSMIERAYESEVYERREYRGGKGGGGGGGLKKFGPPCQELKFC
jgi:hypothetical protein